MKKTKKNLRKDPDNTNIVCDKDINIAKKKYNAKLKNKSKLSKSRRAKITKKKKKYRESFHSKLKNKRKIRRTNCLSECKAKGIQYKKCNKQCSRKALHKIDMETRWNNLILH